MTAMELNKNNFPNSMITLSTLKRLLSSSQLRLIYVMARKRAQISVLIHLDYQALLPTL